MVSTRVYKVFHSLVKMLVKFIAGFVERERHSSFHRCQDPFAPPTTELHKSTEGRKGTIHIWRKQIFWIFLPPPPSRSAKYLLFVPKFEAFLDTPHYPHVWTSYLDDPKEHTRPPLGCCGTWRRRRRRRRRRRGHKTVYCIKVKAKAIHPSL